MITLGKDTVRMLLKRAEKHADMEVCGMVWQHYTGEQTVWALPNVHSQPDRYYAVDPEDLKRGYASMDAAGAVLLAFYHSHPGGKPDPSEADMEGALNEGIHYLIVYPDNLNAYPGTTSAVWRISAWECIEQGILVQDSYEVHG